MLTQPFNSKKSSVLYNYCEWTSLSGLKKKLDENYTRILRLNQLGRINQQIRIYTVTYHPSHKQSKKGQREMIDTVREQIHMRHFPVDSKTWTHLKQKFTLITSAWTLGSV